MEMRTEIVTAESLEQFRISHGPEVKQGDVVQVRMPERYEPYKIYDSTIAVMEYMF